MIFRPDLAEKVLAGTKTVTRRLMSENPRSPWWSETCGYKVDRWYAVQPGRGKRRVGMLWVQDVRRDQLGFLMPVAALEEGFASPALFEEAWAAINGGYDPFVFVWRIEFVARRGDAA